MASPDWDALLAAAAVTVASSTPPVVALPSLQTAPLYIDHTVLKPDATTAQIETLCAEAARWQFKTVCVNGRHVAQAARQLAGTPVGIACVVGFPLGAAASEVKAFEATLAIRHGASEIDMVLPVGALKEKNYDAVYADVAAVQAVCKLAGAALKVIFETSLLTKDEILAASVICKAAGVAFVKTSTGFSTAGANIDDVLLMKAAFGGNVKASGGIRTLKDFRDMVAAGASRIGCSASVAIMTELGSASDTVTALNRS